MRFFAITTLFGAAAFAAETVKITDLSIRDNNGIQSASFKVNADVECSSTDPAAFTDNKLIDCGESDYIFRLKGSNSKYELYLAKATGVGTGIQATTTVQPYCHAGGNGQNDFACTQVGDITIELKQ